MDNLRIVRFVLTNIVYLSWLLGAAVPAHGGQVRMDNTARYAGSGRYDWTVFIEAEKSDLDSIAYVEYTLHPSFPEPVKRISDPNTNFALSANGWGEFSVKGKVVFKDGRKFYREHWLRFEKREKEPPVKRSSPVACGKIVAGNTSGYVGEGRWNWTVFIVSDRETLEQVKCVEYTLHPSFPNPIRKVCDKGSVPGKGFFLKANGWGTFTIEIKVVLKNGDVCYLKHPLVFKR